MSRRRARLTQSRWDVPIFLFPSLIGFSIFILVPIIASVGLSFTNYTGGPRFRFIAFENYIDALTDDRFWSSLGITVRFVVGVVTLQVGLGLTFALLLNQQLRLRTFFRGVIFVPTILSSVAIGLSFALFLNPRRGPVNGFLESLGLAAQPWLASPDTALATVVMVTVWQFVGYYMVLYLGGLSTISPSLYESAEIDGANTMQKLVRITIPMLSPTTFFCVTISIIRAFKVFDQIFVMTGGQEGGGPAGSTMVLGFRIYRNAFVNFRMGYASAEAVLLLAIVLVVTILQYRGQRKWVNYDLS